MKDIDLFFCSISDCGDLRSAMAETCLARWQMVDGITMNVIDEQMLGCSATGFQRMRRIFADEQAESDVYVVADDDYLLPASFDLKECLKVFNASVFAMLSLIPSNCLIIPWTPSDGYITEVTSDVMEHHSVGGVRFCRKNHLSKWPDMEPDYPGFDRAHCAAIRAEGKRCGFFRSFSALHLGENFSTVWTANMAVSK